MRSIILISLLIVALAIFSTLPTDGAAVTLKATTHSNIASNKHTTQAHATSPKKPRSTRSTLPGSRKTGKATRPVSKKPAVTKRSTTKAKPKSQGNRNKRLSAWDWV